MFCVRKKKKGLKTSTGKKSKVILIVFVYLRRAFCTTFESAFDFGEEMVN